ncbi:nbas, partial [Symbiodinium sp. CCMP2456]
VSKQGLQLLAAESSGSGLEEVHTTYLRLSLEEPGTAVAVAGGNARDAGATVLKLWMIEGHVVKSAQTLFLQRNEPEATAPDRPKRTEQVLATALLPSCRELAVLLSDGSLFTARREISEWFLCSKL